jgi:cell division protein FtsI/penicillin-binding protein 2
LLKKYYYDLKADSISAVVINPFNGQIVALAQYPTFNPNNWKQIYKIKPLTQEYNFLLTGDMWKTYVDIPILVEKS